MLEQLLENLGFIGDCLTGHLILSISAILTGVLLSVPLGIYAARNKRAGGMILGVASVLQTIPGIALLAIMVPLLNQIGFLPVFIALCIYSLLPILRNTVVGLNELDGSLVEAARGIGLTPRQTLLRVELPIALPTIVAGIRTSAIWVIGTATLSTPVGYTSLGNLIFSGLQTRNTAAILLGCLLAGVLAISVDMLMKLAENGLRQRQKGRVVAALAGLVLLFGLGFTPALLRESNGGDKRPVVVVGAKADVEQFILARVLNLHLAQAGFRVVEKTNLGSTLLTDALRTGEVDVAIDYSGTLWAVEFARTDNPGREEMLAELTTLLESKGDMHLVAPLGFENAYAIAVRREFAEQHNLKTIEDLAALPAPVSIAGDYEIFRRTEWLEVNAAYNLQNLATREMDAALMYDAISQGTVDAIVAYSTNGRIVARDLVLLADPAEVFPPYDALIIVSQKSRHKEALMPHLKALEGIITQERMLKTNALVDVERQSVAKAAKELFREISTSPSAP
ncbi:MAG: ABC transporter permease/substrate-binding protein [Candidatus Sumerlaeia bacterium]|nr:ABC transporter permease/substrate-binding protein [Candidatus Sumerlaeia bacterium]